MRRGKQSTSTILRTQKQTELFLHPKQNEIIADLALTHCLFPDCKTFSGSGNENPKYSSKNRSWKISSPTAQGLDEHPNVEITLWINARAKVECDTLTSEIFFTNCCECMSTKFQCLKPGVCSSCKLKSSGYCSFSKVLSGLSCEIDSSVWLYLHHACQDLWIGN